MKFVEEEQRRWLRLAGVLSSIGVTFVVSTVLGLGAGYLLDRFFVRTFPWLTIVGLLFGVASGFVSLIRIVSSMNRDDDTAR